MQYLDNIPFWKSATQVKLFLHIGSMYGCNFRTWLGSWLSWKWCSQKVAVVIDIVVLVLVVVNIAEVNGVRECTDLPVRSEAVNIVIRYKIVTREIKYSYLHLFDDGRP